MENIKLENAIGDFEYWFSYGYRKSHQPSDSTLNFVLQVLQDTFNNNMNEPLSSKELERMIGEPVWVSDGEKGAWAILESFNLETNHIEYHIGSKIDLGEFVDFFKHERDIWK